MADVLVLGNGSCSLFLVGDFKGEGAAKSFEASSAEVKTTDGSVLILALPEQVHLPPWCIENAKLSPEAVVKHLNAGTAAAIARAKAQLLDALRRLESVEAGWEPKKFFQLSCAAVGGAKLLLSPWLLGQQQEPVAEFFLRVVGSASANQQASFTLTCVLPFKGLARLRLGCDDFNFSFPEFELPKLDFSNLVALKLPSGEGAARLFERLSRGSLTVTVEQDPKGDPDPLFVIAPTDTQLQWALVKHDTDVTHIDWSQRATLLPALATFNVAATASGNPIFDIQGVKLGSLGNEFVVEGRVATKATLIKDDKIRSGQLGPVEYHLQGVKVTASGVASTTHDFALAATLEFDRLELRLIDDPQVVLAFKGKVQLTPSGTRIEELSLIEPYPIVLVKAAAQALQRGVRAVATFLAGLEGLDTQQLKTLLTILGKFAAAVARAALMVGAAIAGAAEEAASLAAQALNALADALKAILSQLGELVPDGPPSGFHVEVRIALDPIEIRQILVTRKKAAFEPKSISGGGFELSIDGRWMPGVLLDFVDKPGAYLIATRTEDASAEDDEAFATLGTDLWLANEEKKSVTHAPDAKPDKGERAEKRVIQLTAKLKGKKPKELVLVVAGLSRGRPVFLQRLKSTLKSVGSGLMVVDGAFEMESFDDSLDVDVDFQAKRLLPLLGMGETGSSVPPEEDGFLKKLQQGLGQVVWVERTGKMQFDPKKQSVTGDLDLGVKAAGISTTVKLELSLFLKDMAVRLKGGNSFGLKSRRIEENALGLTWVVEQKNPDDRKNNAEVEMFKLSFADGESGFGLNTDNATMELRFGGLSSDGEGIVFKVTDFFVGRRGVDITAEVSDRAVRLNGLDVPFRFQTGALKIRAGRLIEASISGRGTLPPALVGEADCTLALAFTQDESGIVLQSGKVEIDKKGEPIVCHSTRFTLTISDLDVGIQKDGGYHFYFLVTGSLRFTPKPGEFEDGLLGFLKDIEITLERTPLTGDARVLAKHISFQKALNPKKSFNVFNLFTFELRGFGFHPSSPRFDGQPAINLSGQIKFAEIGDVMQPKIDFHGLWIAAPRDGESLPRISAEGLGVDLQLSGAIKVRGSVLAVDPGTRTVEGKEFAPAGYNTYGFLGEGEVDIPGWGSLQASLGFLEIESKLTGERKKAFFVYLQKDKLAVEIPTGFWTFYMREAGFGFGFRYTLAGIKGADEAKSPAQLIRILDEASKSQGDLSRYSAWSPDPQGDRFTLALRAALQAYPAEQVYNEKKEEVAENPFFFDLILAIRSDLTLLASMRGYLGVNYADFRANKDNFRARPGLRGYLYISAPRSELLARMIGDSKGFIGERFPGLQTGQVLRQAVESVDWSSTLYIRPGLFHYELGWPDQLAVRLVDTDTMKISLRGGMIFRAADDGLLWGYNIEANAWLKFGGSAGRSIGAAVEATLQARLVARLLAYLSWKFKGSLVYALVSLDARLEFRIAAWMEVDLGFRSFTIPLSFTICVQFTAVIELAITGEGKVGARVHARIAVSVFGCTLGVSVGFAFNDRTLEDARLRVQRFMAMSITAEEPDSPPLLATEQADARVDAGAEQQEAKENPSNKPVVDTAPVGTALKPPIRFLQGRNIHETNFWLVLHEVAAPAGDPRPYAYALLVPREPDDDEQGAFYASPPLHLLEPTPSLAHTLYIDDLAAFPDLELVKAEGTKLNIAKMFAGGKIDIEAQWQSRIPVDSGVVFTLGHMFDECFLTDTHWERPATGDPVRVSDRRQEPERALRTRRDPGRVSAQNPEQRKLDREQAQQWQAADAARHPSDDRVYQARSTLMNMFIDQFVAFSKSQKRDRLQEAHVLDLGLVFHGPVEQLEQLERMLVGKSDATGQGKIHVLNPSDSWFNRQDPLFAMPRKDISANGVRLGWDMSPPWPGTNALRELQDPDTFLHHYEIVRTVEGHEFLPETMRVKPAATVGRRVSLPHRTDENKREVAVELLPPEWQFTDDLASLGAEVQRALLPTSDENGAMQAAFSWLHAELGEDITLTYSVTPVDIAGTRGLSKSFCVTIERPVPPVRAAEAEVRIVQVFDSEAHGPVDEHEGQHSGKVTSDNLRIYVGLGDAAWQEADPDDKSKPKSVYSITRTYSLVVEQEVTLPAGSYGSDGLTDKIRGLGSAGADAVMAGRGSGKVFPLKFDDFEKLHPKDVLPVGFQKHIREEIEPDQTTLDRLDRWLLLCGPAQGGRGPTLTGEQSTVLLESLWSSTEADPERVAIRFWLRTETTITGGEQPYELQSKLVPVAVELTVVHAKKVMEGEKAPRKFDLSILRPDAFEWPVHLRLPPLTRGQVRVRTGFMHLRMPTPGATLSQWTPEFAADALTVLRDPARRTMAKIEFDAVPIWDPKVVAPIHRSSIAGFDLHALDIDELAPMDSGHLRAKDAIELRLGNDVKAWKRARRVAHIELLSREAASLVPSSNADWLGWQAHYPSETLRVQRSAASAPTRAAVPIRKGWYSARESTPHFAERIPRLRLLTEPMESAVTDLMRRGRPVQVRATLTADAASAAIATFGDCLGEIRLATTHLALARTGHTNEPFARRTEDANIFVRHGETDEHLKRFSAADLRYFMLSLCWPLWQHIDPAKLGGLELVIQASTGEGSPFVNPVSVTIPLDFNSRLHPLLEEVVGELALDSRTRAATSEDAELPRVYRKYAVMVQPVQPLDAREFSNYLAGSAVATDPYGWGVLQGLGLASTIRLFDIARGAFVQPVEMARHVNTVFSTVVDRWRNAFAEDASQANAPCVIGQPFAEVLLKPGADRVVRPFDGYARAAMASKDVDVDADGLAIIQLSLRPVPAQAWRYMRLTLNWPDIAELRLGKTVDPPIVTPADVVVVTTVRRLRAVKLELSPKDGVVLAASVDAIYPPTRAIASMEIDSPTASLDLPWPFPKAEALHLLVRRSDALAIEEFKSRTYVDFRLLVEKSTTTVTVHAVGNESSVNSIELESFESSSSAFCVDSIDDPNSGVDDPFDLFSEQAVDTWSAAMVEKVSISAARRAFESLQANLRAVAPELKFPAHDVKSYSTFMPQYLQWSQRFLDHGAVPEADSAGISLALAAPVKSTPWRLAPDSSGCVTLGIPVDDKWGHAVAYAVKPLSRYAHLMAGVGVMPSLEREQLITPDVKTLAENASGAGAPRDVIGCALAVMPRTERMEPPVILGSSIQEEAWEIVLARHGEESLAASNRPLFARLGKPEVLLSQLRSYRTPLWPTNLAAAFEQADVPKAPNVHPARAAKHASRPEWEVVDYANPSVATTPGALRRLSADRLGKLAHDIPVLWKGAEVITWRPVPPQYKVLALAVARAGIVVSNLSSVLQDDLPRKPLYDSHALETGHKPSLSLALRGGASEFVLRHRLVSHHDLTPLPTRAWNDAVDDTDICWWPDPDVTYNLIRRHSVGNVVEEEELAETHLRATLDASKEPFVVRCRGARWEAQPEPIRVRQIGAKPDMLFELTTTYRIARGGPSGGFTTLRLSPNDLQDKVNFDNFKQAVSRFSLVLEPRVRWFQVAQAYTHTDCIPRLQAYLADCQKLEAALGVIHAKYFDVSALQSDCQLLIKTLEPWLKENANQPKPDEDFAAALKTDAWAFATSPTIRYWPKDASGLLPPLSLKEHTTGDEMLSMWDLPVDDEVQAIQDSGHALGMADSRFWNAMVHRMTGGSQGLRLRAVDGRATMPLPQDPPGTPHPGVDSAVVAWPPSVMKMVTAT